MLPPPGTSTRIGNQSKRLKQLILEAYLHNCRFCFERRHVSADCWDDESVAKPAGQTSEGNILVFPRSPAPLTENFVSDTANYLCFKEPVRFNSSSLFPPPPARPPIKFVSLLEPRI